MDLYKSAVLLISLSGSLLCAAEIPAQAPSKNTIPDTNLALSPDASNMEEGKALYENGQLIAALGKFMTVLRDDSHNPEARQYLRMIVDTMRQNPTISSSKVGQAQALAANPAVQEEIRRMLQLRARLTLDLKAIPSVQTDVSGNVNKVTIDTALLFGDKSGGLKEQGVPVLDRVAAWLKTYGQQPVIIHCYPEELRDATSDGSLFLRRYSELFHFFVEERKLLAARFVSADLLAPSSPAAAGGGSMDLPAGRQVPQPENAGNDVNKVVIETIGTQTAMLDSMPSMTSTRGMTQWLENSISPNRKVFNPDEGEWVNLDLAALTRAGLRQWTFTLTPASPDNTSAKSAKPKTAMPLLQADGKGNLLIRLSWDGRDEKSGSFVPTGSYTAKLVAVNSDGTIKTQEETLQVVRTAPPAAVVEKPKARPAAKKKPAVAKLAAPPMDTAQAAPAVTASSEDASSGEEPSDSAHTIWKQVVQFEPDQSELAPTLKASLERIGKTLEVYPLQKVQIMGFAMTSETNPAALAARRAETVRSILVNEYHVDAKRVIVAGGKTTSDENASKVEMNITN